MASKYQEYLAAQILSEGAIVNYRNLSRALKVHVNVAKQMLYEFYRIQKGKKPESIHATYLLCGVRSHEELEVGKTDNKQNGDDVDMTDAFMSSSIPEPDSQSPPNQVDIISITLVTEELLDDAKNKQSRIDSIHVYSLEPGPIENLQLLSDCTRRVRSATMDEDPLVTWEQYGTIYNPNAKRRTGARPPQPAPAPAPVPAPVPAHGTSSKKPADKPNAAAPTSKNPTGSQPSSSGKGTSKSEAGMSKAPPLKRDSSSIFKSFAKTKPPKKEEEVIKADEKTVQAQEDDLEMAEPSEDEESELAALPEVDREAKEKTEADKKAKAEREATLRKMMEAEDEEEEESRRGDTSEQDVDMAEEEEQANDASAPAPELENPTEEAAVSTTGGRRRGRRRIMKKKHFKDAEGYMVTKEEPAWESFSEDEKVAPPQTKKPTGMPSSAKSSKDDKEKRSSGKSGQGNIMKFFSKK